MIGMTDRLPIIMVACIGCLSLNVRDLLFLELLFAQTGVRTARHAVCHSWHLFDIMNPFA